MVYITWKAIKNLVCNRRMLSLVMVMGFIFSSFYFTESMFSSLSIYRSKTQFDERLREVWVAFSSPQDASTVMQALAPYTREPTFEYMVLCNQGAMERCWPYSDSAPPPQQEQTLPVAHITHKYQNNDVVPAYIPRANSGALVPSSLAQNQAYIPAGLFQKNETVGQPLIRDNKTYQCVELFNSGLLRFGQTIMVGQEKFQQEETVAGVFIGFQPKPSVSLAQQVKQTFLELDAQGQVTAPNPIDWKIMAHVWNTFRSNLLLPTLLFLSLMLVIIGLLATDKERLHIFRICGISGSQLFFYIFFQLFFPCLLGCSVGIGICFFPWVAKINGMNEFFVNATDVAVISFVYIIFCFIVSFAAYRKTRKGTVLSRSV